MQPSEIWPRVSTPWLDCKCTSPGSLPWRFVSSLDAAEEIQGTHQYIKASRSLGAVLQLSSFFEKYREIESVGTVFPFDIDRSAAAARADAARLVLHADLRRLRPSGGLGVHVRRGIQSADHRRHAGRDGEAGSRVWWPARDTRTSASRLLCDQRDGRGDARPTDSVVLCEPAEELRGAFHAGKRRRRAGSDGATLPLVLEDALGVREQRRTHG